MKFTESVIKLLFPEGVTCIGCNSELEAPSVYGLCSECSINKNTRFCKICGRGVVAEGDYCNDCVYTKHYFDCARSSTIYENLSRTLIHRFKIGGARYLSEYLARFMYDTLIKEKWIIDFITFVPISDKNKKIRGFNQSELLAKHISTLTGYAIKDVLKKISNGEESTEHGRKERFELIKDTIKAKEKFHGEKVLLIDDVFTTGATADECARVLKKSGVEKVYVLTFATSVSKPILY